MYLSPSGPPRQRPPLTDPSGKGPPAMVPTAHGPLLPPSAAENTFNSLQDNAMKGLTGQEMLNKARGNVDKKPGIFRQGSMGQEPGGHTNNLGSGLNANMTQDKLGPLAPGNSQAWPSTATQGPTNTTQGLPHSTSPHPGNKGPTSKSDQTSRIHL